MRAAELVGAWRLLDFRVEFEDGRAPVHPFGANAVGALVYSEDGAVSAILSRADRAPLGRGLETSALVEPEGKAEAFDGVLAYAGSWRLEGCEVVHHVEIAQLPDAVGQRLRRTVSLEEGRLELSYTRRTSRGSLRVHRLLWERR